MEKEQVKNRLTKLEVGTSPKFGIMTPQHMVEHLILTLKISNGRIKIPDFEPTEKQLVQKNALIHTEMKFPIGAKAPGLNDQLMDLRFPSLEAAKEELIKSIQGFEDYFSQNPEATPTHPRFGKLTQNEWIIFHRKHIDHHLGQFGV